jgi:membrane-bound metal-dependent hydrolase YbcI (DUF457 family)
MITRHHLALVLMCTLMLGLAFLPPDLLLMGMLGAGSCIGAVLPDIQTTKPKRFGLRTLSFYCTRFSRGICVPVLCTIYYTLFRMNLCPSDKRLTHSLAGIFGISAIVVILSAIPVLSLDKGTVPLAYSVFIAGIITGLIFHFIEDACTRKGVSPFFPFSEVRLSGSIRPCDESDTRIAHYHLHHCSMVIVIAGIHVAGILPSTLSLVISLIALISCLILMVRFSDVETGGGPIIYETPVPGCIKD